MISKFLDPKNDVAFRKIFGSEKNKDILIHFINDMTLFKNKIKDVTFLKTNQDPEIASKKESIVDIMCKDEHENKYIVEMQVSSHAGFEKRAQYYAAKAYIGQMNKGDKQYQNLKEVVFLAIADFTMFPLKKEYKSDHVILDQNTYEHDLKGFSFSFLELPKFKIKEENLKTMIEKWAYYFKYAEHSTDAQIHSIFRNDVIIQKAYHELERFNWTEDELMNYEAVLKRDLDNQAVEAYKKQQMEKELKDALERGLAKGKAEGKAEGKVEEKIEIAKNLITQGLDISLISSATGLSRLEIENLQFHVQKLSKKVD